ncbi:beta strand repeat-containing protein [Acuticoccus kandeliae]|uniref:beta strand repeat-containing protein n=1 Tax=Acuticoccus kandeliae TaxID=2073160 RepID=UPI000D3E7004|nr:calcium-binding protein [Acuticoccus kandeliae]
MAYSLVRGSFRSDEIIGTAEDELILAKAGRDTVSGGVGSDHVRLGPGRDLGRYVLSDAEPGDHDRYNGGRGVDTLRLEFTSAEWADEALRADVAAFLESLDDEPGARLFGQSAKYVFSTFGLTVRGFEVLEVYVDDVLITPEDGETTEVDLGNSESDEEIDFSASTTPAFVTTGTGNDKIVLGSGNDTVNSGEGDDNVSIGDGDDVARTGEGDDTVVAGQGGGNDFIDMGPGEADKIEYPSATAGIMVDLREIDRSGNTTVASILTSPGVGLPADTPVGIATGADIDTDVLIGVEYVDGGSGDDTITGNAFDNLLFGAAGSDQLDGREGTDTLQGGAGDDTLDGGSGTDDDANGIYDVVDYYADAVLAGGITGVSVDLGAGIATDPFGDADTLIDVESVIGTNFADTLVGSTGSDLFAPHGGDDTIDAGDEFDALDYHGAIAVGGTQGISVTFVAEGSGTVIDPFGDTDTFTGIERIVGTLFDDTVVGSDGRDILRGYEGNDIFDAGNGFDRMDYRGQGGTEGVVADLSVVDGDGFATIKDNFGDFDSVRGVEDIRGTNFFGDTLIGDDVDNYLLGDGGDDSIVGNGGHDGLDGGDGNDTLTGGEGDDELSGGGGTDTVILQGVQSDYSVEMTFTGAYVVVDNGGNGDGTDTLRNVETLVFSDGTVDLFDLFGGLEISGTDGDDTLEGTAGDDYLAALAGDDLVLGLAGADFLSGGRGNDTIDGTGVGDDENGIWDTLDYTQEYLDADADPEVVAQGVVVNLATGIGTDPYGDTDTLIDIERVQGTNLADFLVGDDGVNAFDPHAGADTINGGDGNDQLIYYTSEHLGGTQGIHVTFSLTVEGSGTVIDTFGDTDTFTSIEVIRGTRYADEVIGGIGGQTFRGYDGADMFDGGADTDRADYMSDAARGGTDGIVVNWSSPDAEGYFTIRDGFGNLDKVKNVENIRATNSSDQISINHGDVDNDVVALDGDDTISTGGGNDKIDGGDGNDTVVGGTGMDTLGGGGGDDVIEFDDIGFGDFADGGAGTDLLFAFRITETDPLFIDASGIVDPSTGGDVVFTDGVSETIGINIEEVFLIGGLGNDSLIGGAGDDIIGDSHALLFPHIVARGEDTLVGGAGDDLMGLLDPSVGDSVDGGDGTDTLVVYVGFGATSLIVDGSGITDLLAGGDVLFGPSLITIATNIEVLELHGTEGDDSLVGGAGNDTIEAEGGNDTLGGGGGDDFFQIGGGTVVITDFEPGAAAGDQIHFNVSNSFNDGSDVIAAAVQVGSDTVINYGSGFQLTLLGVLPNELAESDFLF